jgi:hypothetical protein
MIIEHNWSLSEAQQVTASGSTLSTNVIDLSDGRDLGRGRPLYMHFFVDTAPTDGVAGVVVAQSTLNIAVVSANDAALSTFSVDVARAVGKFVDASQPVTNPTADWHLWQDSQFYLPIGSPDVGILGTSYSQEVNAGAGAAYSEFLGHRYLGVRYNWDIPSGSLTDFKITARLVLDQSTLPPIYPASTNT